MVKTRQRTKFVGSSEQCHLEAFKVGVLGQILLRAWLWVKGKQMG